MAGAANPTTPATQSVSAARSHTPGRGATRRPNFSCSVWRPVGHSAASKLKTTRGRTCQSRIQHEMSAAITYAANVPHWPLKPLSFILSERLACLWVDHVNPTARKTRHAFIHVTAAFGFAFRGPTLHMIARVGASEEKRRHLQASIGPSLHACPRGPPVHHSGQCGSLLLHRDCLFSRLAKATSDLCIRLRVPQGHRRIIVPRVRARCLPL
jgi:hypothetical protein